MHVVVAGGGPAGLSFAALTAAAGVRVTVLEQQERLGRESRASTWHPSTLDVLDQVGVADPLVAEGVVVDRVQYRHHPSGLIAEFDYGVLSADTRFPFRVQAEQGRITPHLLERLAAAPNATVEFGARVTGVEAHGDRVRVTVDGRSAPVDADYLVGADGAHSAVRHATGIGFEGEAYPRRMLRIYLDFDVRSVVPDAAPATYVTGPWGSGSLLELPDHWRVAFRVDAGEDEETVTARDHVQSLLRRLLPDRPGPYPVIKAEVVALHKRVAGTFRRGRALLIGDAAHINNPSGGFGMNSGIHDAAGLSRTLVAMDRGESNGAALDDYVERRRQVIIDKVLARSDAQVRNLDGAGDGHDWIDGMRRVASDPKQARDFLLRASMFDARPPM